MAKKICLYCGLSLPDTTVFCPECGRTIEDAIGIEVLHGVYPEGNEHAQTDTVSLRRTTRANGCPYCSLLLPNSAVFCPECGRPTERVFEIRPVYEGESGSLRKEMKGEEDCTRQQGSYYVSTGLRAHAGKSPKRRVRLARRIRNMISALSTR